MSHADVSFWLSAALQIAIIGGVILTGCLQVLTHRRLSTIRDDVRTIELATNSMKDALVAATDRAAGLAGEERGREQERSRGT